MADENEDKRQAGSREVVIPQRPALAKEISNPCLYPPFGRLTAETAIAGAPGFSPTESCTFAAGAAIERDPRMFSEYLLAPVRQLAPDVSVPPEIGDSEAEDFPAHKSLCLRLSEALQHIAIGCAQAGGAC